MIGILCWQGSPLANTKEVLAGRAGGKIATGL